MAIAPSGLIGLVIHGAAEAYTQEMIPFGAHKEYGYWRSNFHRSIRDDNFDVLDLRIENDPDTTTSRQITSTACTVGLPNTLEVILEILSVDCQCLQPATEKIILSYLGPNTEADDPAVNAMWSGYIDAKTPCDPTLSGDQSNVEIIFTSDGTNVQLKLSGCVSGSDEDNTYSGSASFDCTEFTFGATCGEEETECPTDITLAGCCGGGVVVNNVIRVVAADTSEPGTPGLKDEAGGGTFSIVGSGIVQKAGTQKDAFGSESPQERGLYLPENSYVIADSGGKSVCNAFTLFASFVPDGDNAGKIIASKFKEQTATFVLGTDDLGKIYVRADKFEDGANSEFIARSQKPYHQYKYPIQAVAVKGTGVGGGESNLKLYINCNLESSTPDFTRVCPVARKSDKIWVGRTERRIGKGDFKGWINELGISSKPLSSGDIDKLCWDRKQLTNFLQETTSVYSSGGAFDNSFVGAYNIKDETYVQFTVESGGGAFDTDLWGLGNFAVSSVASFPLSNVDANFWQLSPEPSGIELDLWVRHDTSHSGCFLTASISKEPSLKGITNLQWNSGAYLLGSGVTAKKIESDGSRTTIPDGGAQAKASLVFGDTEFNSVNNGTITLTDHKGTSKGFKIKNDYTALVANNEFEAGGVNTAAAANFVDIVNDSTYGFNGTIVAADNGSGSVTLTQAAIGTIGNTDIVYTNSFDNVLESVPSSATATIVFGDTEFDDVNSGTIALIDYTGVTKTFKIKNDYSAIPANGEFESGTSQAIAAENFTHAVNNRHSAGFDGTIVAVNNGSGSVTLTQGTAGITGNTAITYAASFASVLEAGYSTEFAGGDGGAIPLAFTGGKMASHVGGAGIQKITLQGLFQKNWGFNDFDDTNELNLSGKESLKSDIDEHNLNLTLYYPAATGDGAFDAEFKIYKAKVNARSFRTFNHWANDKTLYVSGSTATAASGIADLYMEASQATQSMDLYLHMAKGSSMLGSSAFSGTSTILQNSGISLYVDGNIPNAQMNLFLKTKVPTSVNNNQNLFLYAANNPFLSGQYDTLKLYLEARDDGKRNASMNMVFPQVAPGKFNDRRLLYTKGIQPHTASTMDLFLWNAQSGINNSQELYLKTVDSVKSSGSMNMFIKPYSPQFLTSSRFGSTATIAQNSGISLHVHGRETISPIATKATATLQFSPTDWSNTNRATISLTDVYGVNKTYMIRNDYGADSSNNEFNAGAANTVAADNFAVTINGSSGHNGSIIAIDSGNGLVVLQQATTGFGGHTPIIRSDDWDNNTSINAPTTFVGGISTGIKQNATARFTFDSSDFDSVNGASVTLIDANGTSVTYTIKNDYLADPGSDEFNAGANRGAAAENFAQAVDSANGHYGTIHALDSAGVRFTSGGYDFSDGVVVFKQETQGDIGETEITNTATFNSVLVGSVPARFSDGLNAGMSLVMPNTVGSGINNTTLYVKGYE